LSERLIGWVQLVMTATFAALYVIAPNKTLHPFDECLDRLTLRRARSNEPIKTTYSDVAPA